MGVSFSTQYRTHPNVFDPSIATKKRSSFRAHACLPFFS
jgi:hypothetical protein